MDVTSSSQLLIQGALMAFAIIFVIGFVGELMRSIIEGWLDDR